MSRRNRDQAAARAAGEASRAASEAGRTLQAQRSFENEPIETSDEPKNQELVNLTPTPNPRNASLEEIAERRAKDSGTYSEPEEVKAEVPTEPAVEAPVVASDAVVAPQVEAPKTVKVKVDGEEFDVLESEVEEAGGVKAYQREKASENRLKKANETLAQARQFQAQIAQWAEAQTKAAQPAPQSTDDFIKAQVDVIRYGSAEESAAALKAVLEKSTQKVDENLIIGQAVSAMQQQAAEQAFVQEFADLVHTPLLLKTIIREKDERLAEAKKQGKQISDWPTFYRSLGNEVRGAIGRQSQPAAASLTTGSTSQAPSDKEARKASIVNLPTAAARAALPEAEKPETRGDTLNQMRKARGLPTG